MLAINGISIEGVVGALVLFEVVVVVDVALVLYDVAVVVAVAG